METEPDEGVEETLPPDVVELVRELTATIRTMMQADKADKAREAEERDTMSRRYAYKLRSNVKSAQPFEVELGPKTLVLGPNASGKDRVVQALELATRGRVSDLAGKADVGQALRLMALAPGQEGELFAEVEMNTEGPDGQTAYRFSTSGTTESAKRPDVPEIGDLVFPLQELNDLFANRGEDAQREWFTERLVGTVTLDDVLAEVPTMHHEVLTALWAETDGNGGQRVTAVRSHAKELKLGARKKAKEAKKATKAVAGVATSGRPTQGAIDEAEAEVRRLQGEVDQLTESLAELNARNQPTTGADLDHQLEEAARRREEAAQALRAAEARVADIRAQGRPLFEEIQQQEELLVGLRQRLPEIDQEIEGHARILASMPEVDPQEELRAMLVALRTVTERQAQQAGAGQLDCCAVCGQDIEPMSATQRALQVVGEVNRALADLDARREDAETRQTVEARHAEWVQAKKDHTNYIESFVAGLDQRKQRLQALESALDAAEASATQAREVLQNASAAEMAAQEAREAATVTGEGHDTGPDVETVRGGIVASLEEARAELTAAQGKLAELRAAAKAYAGVSKHRDEAAKHSKLEQEYAGLEAALTEAMGRLLDTVREAFVAKARSYLPKPKKMPDGGQFDLILRDGKRNVCMVGLRKKAGFVTALSGAEWNIVTCAIACAISEGADFALIVPEERAYDRKTLANWMRALTKAPAQVIITSPTKPFGRTAKGWTILETKNIEGRDPEEVDDTIEDDDEESGEQDNKGPSDSPEEGTKTLKPKEEAPKRPKVPEWVAKCGKRLTTVPMAKLPEVMEERFGGPVDFVETFNSGRSVGVWHLADNGAAVFQMEDKATIYPGTAESRPTAK